MNTTTLTAEQKRVGAALLAIRLAAGLVFLYHGSAILFGAFGGPGLAGFSAYTHLPTPVAFLVGLAQFCGGLAMLTGILARLGAIAIIPVMLGAIFMVHLPKGFDISKGGMEYALTQLLIAVAVLITGAGPYSLAYLLFPARIKPSEEAAAPRHTPQAPPAPQV
jgi:putative oxidoreductase